MPTASTLPDNATIDRAAVRESILLDAFSKDPSTETVARINTLWDRVERTGIPWDEFDALDADTQLLCEWFAEDAQVPFPWRWEARDTEIIVRDGQSIHVPAPDWSDTRDLADLSDDELDNIDARLKAMSPEWLTPEERKWSAAGFASLADLLANPALLEPPEEVIPGLAWAGMLTVYAAREKLGKSTLTAHAASEISCGGMFLGAGAVNAGRVVWAGLEEATSHAVRRFQEMGARGDNIVLVHEPPSGKDLAGRVADILRCRRKPRLVVIDSLTEWASLIHGMVPEEGDSAGWSKVVRPLTHLAHETGVAIVLIHHARKSDGKYRGSTAIGAAADVIVEMTGNEDTNVRQVRGRGRGVNTRWTWSMAEDGTLRMGAGEVPLDFRILADLTAHAGSTRAEGFERVGGDKTKYLGAVKSLIENGQVEERSESRPGGGHPMTKLYVTAAVPDLEAITEDLK